MYTIELTKKQAEILSYVCDRFARIVIGQLTAGIEDELLEALAKHRCGGELNDLFWEEKENIRKTLDELHTKCWSQPPNATYGIRYSEQSDILFDINSVIRHQLFLDNGGKKNGATVDSYPAHHWAKEPLIKIKKTQTKLNLINMIDFKRPKKEDYDFNDNIEAVRYAKDMDYYADKLENKLHIDNEIYATYDESDGEIFCAFTSKKRCEIEQKECGCGMQTIRLVKGEKF